MDLRRQLIATVIALAGVLSNMIDTVTFQLVTDWIQASFNFIVDHASLGDYFITLGRRGFDAVIALRIIVIGIDKARSLSKRSLSIISIAAGLFHQSNIAPHRSHIAA